MLNKVNEIVANLSKDNRISLDVDTLNSIRDNVLDYYESLRKEKNLNYNQPLFDVFLYEFKGYEVLIFFDKKRNKLFVNYCEFYENDKYLSVVFEDKNNNLVQKTINKKDLKTLNNKPFWLIFYLNEGLKYKYPFFYI